MRHTSLLHVDLSALDHNLDVLRSIVGSRCAICPIVKADGYGLGAGRIGKRLANAGADMLAVYTPEQAAALTKVAAGVPLLILMPMHEFDRTDELYRLLVTGNLHLVVHDLDHLNRLQKLADRFACTLPLHLEIDTGMSRGGAMAENVPAILSHIAENRWLRLAGISTHFASAETDEEFTQTQLARFNRACRENAAYIPGDCLIHVANTYAMLRNQRYHRSMVRIGLAWAGYGSEDIKGGERIPDSEHLQPALRWTSTLVQLKWIEAGTTVGYRAKWAAPRRTLIGLAPVGYADGYPSGVGASGQRDTSAAVTVVAGNQRAEAAIVGVVNMDQITVDLTDAVKTLGDEIAVGTEIELISPDRTAPNHLPKLAAAAGITPHEVICRINPRIRRVYATEPFSPSSTPSRPAAVG